LVPKGRVVKLRAVNVDKVSWYYRISEIYHRITFKHSENKKKKVKLIGTKAKELKEKIKT